MSRNFAAELDSRDFAGKFWRRDGSAWSSDPDVQAFISSFLGWTDSAAKMKLAIPELSAFAADVKQAGFRHVVICGMGGSSLSSLVLRQVFARAGGPALHVLDSTFATTVSNLEQTIRANGGLETALFVVASKSGSTVEPKSFEEYFYARTGQNGQQFVAITDPGSPMEAESVRRGYRHIFRNDPEIGGRYSVLSYFGLVTASVLGVDLDPFLSRAAEINASNDPSVATSEAMQLGTTLASHAEQGRDKVTFVTSPTLSSFGLWAEQLIAESTGKEGRGVLPVAEEPVGDPAEYASDRVFVVLTLAGETGPVPDFAAVGHPVIRRHLESREDLGREFMTWEVATATLGACLGINPFDQPNVQEAKDVARQLLAQLQATGSIEEPEPDAVEAGVSAYAPGVHSVGGAFEEFVLAAQPGDYIAILGYLDETDALNLAVAELRKAIRARTRVVTTFGYGPRYLHSTGQFHKGGPARGHFLVLTGHDRPGVEIPGLGCDFASLCRAQALGDMAILESKGRPVLRLHFESDPATKIIRLTDGLRLPEASRK